MGADDVAPRALALRIAVRRSLIGLFFGLDEEGDTYDTQAEFFQSAWERFWTQIAGPDEAARVAIFEAISKHFGEDWQFVSATRGGRKVFVQVDENQSRELRPNTERRR